MKKLITVMGQMTVTCWTEVEIETENMTEEEVNKKALDIAEERADNDEKAEVLITGYYSVKELFHFDNDGTPNDLKVIK